MLNLHAVALKGRLARLLLPSCRRSCPQPSDQKKQRQSRFPQLPDKHMFDFYFHEKPCYLVEVLKHRGELPAGRTPVSREVVEDQILVTQKHCISEVQRGHKIIKIARGCIGCPVSLIVSLVTFINVRTQDLNFFVGSTI